MDPPIAAALREPTVDAVRQAVPGSRGSRTVWRAQEGRWASPAAPPPGPEEPPNYRKREHGPLSWNPGAPHMARLAATDSP